MELWILFLIGFFSSFGHCIGMCGPFVLTYSFKLSSTVTSGSRLSISHVLYNSGRIISYMVLGVAFSLVGNSLTLFSKFHGYQGVLEIFAGILMIFIALEMGEIQPAWLKKWVPGLEGLHKTLAYYLNRVNSRNIFFLGFLNGFIPCGLVYAAGAKAAAESPVHALWLMFFFGLGTVPALFLIGVSSNFMKMKFRKTMFQFATYMVLALALATISRGISAIQKKAPPKNATPVSNFLPANNENSSALKSE